MTTRLVVQVARGHMPRVIRRVDDHPALKYVGTAPGRDDLIRVEGQNERTIAEALGNDAGVLAITKKHEGVIVRIYPK